MKFLGAAPLALAADTASITAMEIVDNGIMLVIPGAMDAGLDTTVFWGNLAFALAVAAVTLTDRARQRPCSGPWPITTHNSIVSVVGPATRPD